MTPLSILLIKEYHRLGTHETVILLFYDGILLYLGGIIVLMRRSQLSEQKNYTTGLVQWGREDCSPGHEFGGIRDYYLLHIIQQGEGVYHSRRKRWKLSRGDAFLIFPGQKHSYQADLKEPWSYFWLGFTGEFSDLFAPLCINPDNPILHTDTPEELLKIFSEIPSQRIYQHPGIRLENLGRLNTILGKLSRGKAQSKDNAPLTGKEGSHHVHSMELFYKEQTGTTLGSSIRNLRLLKAEEYLKTGWSAKETAYSCGYRDYNNFLKAFKKAYGMTPGAFKG
jgi:hypothetical protein